MARYQLEEWDAAIENFENGFRKRPMPEFLFNIAQCHRFAHRPEKALQFYQKYLRMDPNTSQRAEVEKQIANLSEIVDRSSAAARQPPTSTIDPTTGRVTNGTGTSRDPSRERRQANEPGGQTVEPRDSDSTNQNVVATPPEKKPIYKKAWFWATIGGGVVVVGGLIALGVVLSRPGPQDPLPPVRFSLTGGGQ